MKESEDRKNDAERSNNESDESGEVEDNVDSCDDDAVLKIVSSIEYLRSKDELTLPAISTNEIAVKPKEEGARAVSEELTVGSSANTKHTEDLAKPPLLRGTLYDAQNDIQPGAFSVTPTGNSTSSMPSASSTEPSTVPVSVPEQQPQDPIEAIAVDDEDLEAEVRDKILKSAVEVRMLEYASTVSIPFGHT